MHASQFQYANGSVASILAILEAPKSKNTNSPQNNESQWKEDEKSVNTGNESESKDSRERLTITKRFLGVSWRQFLYGVITYFVGNSFGFGISKFFHSNGVPLLQDYIQTIAMITPGPLLFWALSVDAPSSSKLKEAFGSCASYSPGKILSSHFPGLGFFVVYMALSISAMALSVHFHGDDDLNCTALILIKVFIGLLLTNIQTAWIHAVITKSSKRSFWQRIPGFQDSIQTMPAALLDLTLPMCVNYLTRQFLSYLGEIGGFDLRTCYLPFALEILTSVFTRAIYIKVAASLLPHDEETIITLPSDSERLGVLEAFRGINLHNWHYYRRVVRNVLVFELPFLTFTAVALGMELHFADSCAIPGLLNLFVSMFLA